MMDSYNTELLDNETIRFFLSQTSCKEHLQDALAKNVDKRIRTKELGLQYFKQACLR